MVMLISFPLCKLSSREHGERRCTLVHCMGNFVWKMVLTLGVLISCSPNTKGVDFLEKSLKKGGKMIHVPYIRGVINTHVPTKGGSSIPMFPTKGGISEILVQA
jgi:hypothetical protein